MQPQLSLIKLERWGDSIAQDSATLCASVASEEKYQGSQYFLQTRGMVENIHIRFFQNKNYIHLSPQINL